MAAEISASETEKSLEFSPKILRVFSLPLYQSVNGAIPCGFVDLK